MKFYTQHEILSQCPSEWLSVFFVIIHHVFGCQLDLFECLGYIFPQNANCCFLSGKAKRLQSFKLYLWSNSKALFLLMYLPDNSFIFFTLPLPNINELYWTSNFWIILKKQLRLSKWVGATSLYSFTWDACWKELFTFFNKTTTICTIKWLKNPCKS